jgi:UPF0755 protein
MKKLIVSLLLIVFVGIGALGLYGFYFVSTPASGDTTEKVFDVPPGSSLIRVANRLEKEGLIKNAKALTLYARLIGKSTSLHVGEYSVNPGMTPRQILDVISSGKSIAHMITIPEGFNIFEISQVLEQKWPGRGEEFLRVTRDPNFVKELLGTERPSLEGYLFPETYAVTKYMGTEAIVRMMYAKFVEVYSALMKENSKIKMDKHTLVIFASLIEKETGAPEERPLISSVFHNRLRQKMRLQTDPTIIYGHWVTTGEYLSNIRRVHLTEANDYNTYVISGLPKGPIANPGLESLRAALNPVESDYLFFVSRNDGTHVFSKNYQDHNTAVKNYQLNPAARAGKSWRDRKKE